MGHSCKLLVGLLFAFAGSAIAGEGNAAPEIHLPDAMHWASPPWDARVSATWILGAEKGTGRYLQRVRIQPGGRIPRHDHPDARETTVLEGTLHVMFGMPGGEFREVVLPVGSVYVVPPRTPHEVWAGDSAVLYQESGVGPTSTDLINP